MALLCAQWVLRALAYFIQTLKKNDQTHGQMQRFIQVFDGHPGDLVDFIIQKLICICSQVLYIHLIV